MDVHLHSIFSWFILLQVHNGEAVDTQFERRPTKENSLQFWMNASGPWRALREHMGQQQRGRLAR